VVTGSGVAASGGDQVTGEAREGFGQHNGDRAEAKLDGGVAGVDVVDGESADCRGSLGVEQDQQPGDAVVGVEDVVVQQLFGLVPALFLVQRASRAGPSGGGELQVGVDALGDHTAHEVSGLGPVADVVAGQPCVEVGLPTGGQGEPLGAQPVEESRAR
jgi:hypothetical protein